MKFKGTFACENIYEETQEAAIDIIASTQAAARSVFWALLEDNLDEADVDVSDVTQVRVVSMEASE